MTLVSTYSSAPVAAAGLRQILGELDGFTWIGGSPELDLFQAHIREAQPGIVILEVNSAISLESLKETMRVAPGASVVLWVDGASIEFVSQAIGLGVLGILPRDCTVGMLEECLRDVAEGRLWIDRQLGQRLLSVDKVALSPRERQIMGLLAQGLRNKEIAWQLCITEGTVKVYLSRLFDKLGADDRLELALLALRNLAGGASGQAALASQHAGKDAAPALIPRFVSTEYLHPLRSQAPRLAA